MGGDGRRARTEAGLGADEGAEDGVVVGRDVRAVDAAGLDRVVLIRVEHVPRAPAAHLASGERRCPPAASVAAGGELGPETERTKRRPEGCGTGGGLASLGSARACDGS
jgi:hypothetical protein